jgi:hypothetical protein
MRGRATIPVLVLDEQGLTYCKGSNKHHRPAGEAGEKIRRRNNNHVIKFGYYALGSRFTVTKIKIITLALGAKSRACMGGMQA